MSTLATREDIAQMWSELAELHPALEVLRLKLLLEDSTDSETLLLRLCLLIVLAELQYK